MIWQSNDERYTRTIMSCMMLGDLRITTWCQPKLENTSNDDVHTFKICSALDCLFHCFMEVHLRHGIFPYCDPSYGFIDLFDQKKKTLFMLLKMCLRIYDDEILDAQLTEKCLNWNGKMIWWRKIASYWDQNNPKSKRHRLCSVSLSHVEMMLDEVNIFSCVHSADWLRNNIMSLFQNHSNCFSFP